MNVFDLIKSDCRTYGIGGIIKTYFIHPSFRYTFWLRLCAALKKPKIIKYTLCIPVWLIMRRMSVKYGIAINPNIPIGHSLCIVHNGTVFVNVKSIGNNCRIFHGVTLGVNGHSQTNKGIPTIGDNVMICTGALIFGDITLNNNCVVAAGSVVTKNVHENEVVAGVPAKVIRMNK